MDKVINRLKFLKKVTATLQRLINNLHQPIITLPNNEETKELYMLALIQQFEICYELT